jgi:O-antigen/teichoic acid export membrane protein
MRSNLLNKFLSFSYGSWVGLIIGFLGTIVTTRILDPIDFGKASMFTLVLNFVNIVIMLGLDQSFIRFFYEEDKEKRGGLLYNSISIPLILSVISLISIFVFRNVLSIWLFDETNLTIILFLMIGIVVQIFYKYSIIVIRMQQKGRLYSNLLIFYRIIEFSTIIFLYFIFGANYKIIVFSTIASFCIISIIGIYNEKEMWKINKTKFQNLKHSQSKLIKFGAPLVVTILLTLLFQSFDKIAIRHWSNFKELGLYSAAFKIIALVNVLQTSFSTFWTPISYEKFESEPDHKFFYQNMFRLVSFAMFFIAIISIVGKDIIVLLFGKEYREAAQIMPFLVFMPVMYTVSEITVVGINFFKKPKWHILIATAVCLINIIGNVILVP